MVVFREQVSGYTRMFLLNLASQLLPLIGVALFIPSVISLTKDMSTAGVRIGVATVPLGIALLLGTPIAGAIVQHRGVDNPDWWAGAVYTGVLLLVASALLFVIHLMEERKRRRESQVDRNDDVLKPQHTDEETRSREGDFSEAMHMEGGARERMESIREDFEMEGVRR
jgi:MFS family permease